MLDTYEYGEVTRISPEAPVQIVNFTHSKKVLGGAGNTANNLTSLGAQVYLIGVIGEDNNADILKKCLEESKINSEGIFIDKTKSTIVKKRIVSGKNQLLRIDYEKKGFIAEEIQNKIKEFVCLKINTIDVMILSDYDKGLLTPELMKYLIKLSNDNNKPIVLDGKSQNFDSFKNVTLVTPNLIEAKKMSGEQDDIEKIGKILVEKLNANIFLTRGEDGISLFEKNGKITHIPTKKVPVYDVTGAGDTVVAVSALGLASGLNLVDIAEIANLAGRIVVQKSGTATVTLSELTNTYINENKTKGRTV